MKKRHGVWQVPYRPAVGSGSFAVEVLSFARLRQMDGAGRRRQLQRPAFHVVGLVERGTGEHRADFHPHPLLPGTAVWIRPGTVHQWSDVDDVDGPLVLFTPSAVHRDVAAEVARPLPPSWPLTGTAWTLVRRSADHLRVEQQTGGAEPGVASEPALRLLLAVLIHRLALTAPAAPPERIAREVFLRFREAVEGDFANCHQVTEYARRLGYSPRTLARATLAAAGVGPKRLIEERLVLEARRLLATTDLPVAGCAVRLGFPDAAAFSAFFRRHAATSPSAWRATAARDG